MDKTYTNGSDRTEEHILVCLSSSPSNKKIVHTAAAMAAALHARFTALYVQNRILSDTSDKKRLEEHIHFAEKLGAEIVTTHGENIPVQIAEYAHLSNVTKIVIGQSNAKRSHFFSRAALTEQLIKAAPDIDIHIIPDAVKSEIYPKKQPLLYTNKPSFKRLLFNNIHICHLYTHRIAVSKAEIYRYKYCYNIHPWRTAHFYCNKRISL